MTSPSAAADDLPVALTGALRREVGLVRLAERRRLFAARLGVGEPGARGPGTALSGEVAPWRGRPWPPGAWLDAGVRLDVADRLLEHPAATAAPSPAAWLVRPGTPTLHDEDLAWLAALRHAASARSMRLGGFWVVTRYGWLDPVGGASRTWKRLRVQR